MNSLLVLPEDATNAEVYLKGDGATEVRWYAPSIMAEGETDYWAVTLAADQRAADVALHYKGAFGPYASAVLRTIGCVLQFQSGLNVNVTMKPDTANM